MALDFLTCLRRSAEEPSFFPTPAMLPRSAPALLALALLVWAGAATRLLQVWQSSLIKPWLTVVIQLHLGAAGHLLACTLLPPSQGARRTPPGFPAHSKVPGSGRQSAQLCRLTSGTWRR